MTGNFEFDALLSYSSLDKAVVRALARRLRRKGVRVWFDEWVIKPGDDIYLAIERGLEVTRSLVLCLSPSAVSSAWVGLERSTVLFRDPSNKGRRFVPLLLADCKLPDALRRYKHVDFRTRSKAAFNELLHAIRGDSLPSGKSRVFQGSAETRRDIAGLLRSRRNEWERLRVDFQTASRAYHDVEMKVLFLTDEGALPKDLKQPNHVISLWQFFGVYPGHDTADRIRNMKATRFGITGAELSAMGVIVGEQTPLFCKMANRSGSLIPNEINITLISELSKRIEADAKPGKPIFVMNGNPLAKWLNLVLIITSTWHPERFKEHTLQVDPFVASLAVFDFIVLDE